MLKISQNIRIVMVIAILLTVVAGCVETKAPEARLEIVAKAATGLTITHAGGDPFVLSSEKITVKRQVNDKVVDGLNGVALFGNTLEFQDQPVIEKLAAGEKIKHKWNESLMIGDVLMITIQDVPSGKMIVNTKISVS
jgi:FlaG/FlaF family flagellin (archaellin)